MSRQKQEKKAKKSLSKIFCENPYDLETFFESLSIASSHEKELIFIDKFIAYMRLDPQAEIAEICFKILLDLKITKFEL